MAACLSEPLVGLLAAAAAFCHDEGNGQYIRGLLKEGLGLAYGQAAYRGENARGTSTQLCVYGFTPTI